MALTPGSLLGSYEIVAPLGAGGMGAVYRARDTKLGRTVALKVILAPFAADEERISRFEREARMLAALNHPRIAALFGMEEDGGQHFLVMELVEGETLAERLHRGAMSVEEAIAIGVQIAEALEAAHEKGVVHRDLKPANIKITPEQQVKVLDFGLAKAVENERAAPDMANSPTLSMMATQAGVILGTAAYMSPEQAKGFPADHRSDVFSFGAVLFEMLTGRQPFQGDTAPEILASVLVREPEVHRLPPDANPRLVELVMRCLEKSPRKRWQHAGDVRAELETLAAAPRSTIMAPHASAAPGPRWKRAIAPAAVAVLAAALTGAAAWNLRPAAPAAVTRFAFLLPEDEAWVYRGRMLLDIAPDGSRLAYVSNNKLRTRSLAEFDGSLVPGAAQLETVSQPVFSPNGTHLAFFSAGDQTLKKVPVAGGAAVNLCQTVNPLGISWGADGWILFTTVADGIMRVSENGGRKEPLVPTEGETRYYRPQILPDGKALLMSISQGAGADRWNKGSIVVHDLASGDRKVLVEGGSDARLLPNGLLAYALEGVIYAAPFDARRVEITGPAVPVLEGVFRSPGTTSGAAQFAVAADGTIAYVPGPVVTDGGGVALVTSDRQGTPGPLPLVLGEYSAPRVSRDGRQVVFEAADAGASEVYIYDVDGRTAMRRLTFGGNNRAPVFSPDGSRVAFYSDREGDSAIYWTRADGSGGLERLTTNEPGAIHVPEAFSPDGRTLLFSLGRSSQWSLWALDVAARKAAQYSVASAPGPLGAAFSPDGRWVAYAAPSGSSHTIYAEPFPSTGARYELPRRPGDDPHHPVWAPDGAALFYTSRPGGFDSVSVSTRPVFAYGNPVAAPRAFRTQAPSTRRPYDILPDGRFIGLGVAGQSAEGRQDRAEIRVVRNWFEELRGKLQPR
ncbi:MAG TPA: protein kinase [Vicinamibacterales bacterium]